MKVLNDWKCVNGCNWCHEYLLGPDDKAPICPICDQPLEKIIGKFKVANGNKGNWNK